MSDDTSTPYGDAGYGQRDEQRDNYRHDLVTGVTNVAQRLTLILASQAGAKGITIAELRESKGALHHGKMSSALTALHIEGRLAALKTRRDRCGVYVLPEHVKGRETRAYKPNRKPISTDVIRGVLIDHHRNSIDQWCLGAHCSWAPGFGTTFPEHQAEKIAEALS